MPFILNGILLYLKWLVKYQRTCNLNGYMQLGRSWSNFHEMNKWKLNHIVRFVFIQFKKVELWFVSTMPLLFQFIIKHLNIIWYLLDSVSKKKANISTRIANKWLYIVRTDLFYFLVAWRLKIEAYYEEITHVLCKNQYFNINRIQMGYYKTSWTF